MTAPLLIFGRHGQLARALQRSCLAQGWDVRVIGSEDCDLVADPRACMQAITGDVRAVVNATGFTHVDDAESRDHANTALNATAPGAMAAACSRAGVPFVHVSTDYVFSGAGDTPWTPLDRTSPLNAYGRAKRAGERAVAAAGGDSLTLRTSWVFDGTGANFLTTMLRLARERNELRVVADQKGRPTHAGHLGEAILAAIGKGWRGTQLHHVQGIGETISWAEFARAILSKAGRLAGAGGNVRVVDIPTADYPTPARRPAHSTLDTKSFEAAFHHPLLPWRDGLDLALWERNVGDRRQQEPR